MSNIKISFTFLLDVLLKPHVLSGVQMEPWGECMRVLLNYSAFMFTLYVQTLQPDWKYLPGHHFPTFYLLVYKDKKRLVVLDLVETRFICFLKIYSLQENLR